MYGTGTVFVSSHAFCKLWRHAEKGGIFTNSAAVNLFFWPISANHSLIHNKFKYWSTLIYRTYSKGFASRSALDPHFWSPSRKFFLPFPVKKTLIFRKNQAPHPEIFQTQDPDPQTFKTLHLDPDPQEMDADPKPWEHYVPCRAGLMDSLSSLLQEAAMTSAT